MLPATSSTRTPKQVAVGEVVRPVAPPDEFGDQVVARVGAAGFEHLGEVRCHLALGRPAVPLEVARRLLGDGVGSRDEQVRPPLEPVAVLGGHAKQVRAITSTGSG